MNKKLKPLMSSEKMDWGTPKDFFDGMEKLFGKFDLDVCAGITNYKCQKYYSESDNALVLSWHQYTPVYYGYACNGQEIRIPSNSPPEKIERCWMNPPYGRVLPKWIDKAIEESKKGVEVIVLVPSRTDTKWFKKAWENAEEVYFVHGRLKFEGAPTTAPFPSVVFRFTGQQTRNFPEPTIIDTKGKIIG